MKTSPRPTDVESWYLMHATDQETPGQKESGPQILTMSAAQLTSYMSVGSQVTAVNGADAGGAACLLAHLFWASCTIAARNERESMWVRWTAICALNMTADECCLSNSCRVGVTTGLQALHTIKTHSVGWWYMPMTRSRTASAFLLMRLSLKLNR